jgi:hypothetical protein
MALISIAEASRLTGKSIPTIYRHINSGKLSKTGDKIDTSEIMRLYGAFTNTADSQNYQNKNQDDNLSLSMLQRENEILRQQIKHDRDQIEDIKDDRDHWRQQATMLLSHQPEQQKPDIAKTNRKEDSLLWKRLFSRNS